MEEKNIKQKLDDILGEIDNATGALDLIAEGIETWDGSSVQIY